MLEPGEVTECGHGGHRDRAWHPAERLERVDDRGESPGLHLVGEFLFQPRQPFGVCSDRSEVCLEHNLLRRGGTDDLAKPSEVGWPPGGAASGIVSVILRLFVSLEWATTRRDEGQE